MTVYANINLHVTIQQVQELRHDLTKLYLTSGTSSTYTSRRRSSIDKVDVEAGVRNNPTVMWKYVVSIILTSASHAFYNR